MQNLANIKPNVLRLIYNRDEFDQSQVKLLFGKFVIVVIY